MSIFVNVDEICSIITQIKYALFTLTDAIVALFSGFTDQIFIGKNLIENNIFLEKYSTK